MLLKPGKENQEYAFMFSGADKILHLGIFFVLGFLFHFAFPKIKTLSYFLLLLFYGFLTEYLQFAMQLGRSAEFLDIVADAIGISFAYLIFQNKNKLPFISKF
jgi:VanZ family protein